MRPMRRWGRLAVGLLLTVASAAFSSCQAESCESMPVDQFRLTGVTYHLHYEEVAEALVGPEVGVITSGLPQAAFRCGAFRLKDGQGSLPVGTSIHVIIGTDPTVALAAEYGDHTMVRWLAEGSAD